MGYGHVHLDSIWSIPQDTIDEVIYRYNQQHIIHNCMYSTTYFPISFQFRLQSSLKSDAVQPFLISLDLLVQLLGSGLELENQPLARRQE